MHSGPTYHEIVAAEQAEKAAALVVGARVRVNDQGPDKLKQKTGVIAEIFTEARTSYPFRVRMDDPEFWGMLRHLAANELDVLPPEETKNPGNTYGTMELLRRIPPYELTDEQLINLYRAQALSQQRLEEEIRVRAAVSDRGIVLAFGNVLVELMQKRMS